MSHLCEVCNYWHGHLRKKNVKFNYKAVNAFGEVNS